MKKIINYIIGLTIALTSCSPEKTENVEKVNPFPENTLFAITPTTDPNYCSPDSVVGTDCGLGELYITKEGTVLYSPFCMGMDSMTYYIGNYTSSDTAVVCSFSSEYSHALGCYGCPEEETAPIDPNAGKIKSSSNLTLILKKTNCKEYPYFIANSQDEYRQGLKFETDKNSFCKTVSEIKALSQFHCSYTTAKTT
jgi:hypothetical protein